MHEEGRTILFFHFSKRVISLKYLFHDFEGKYMKRTNMNGQLDLLVGGRIGGLTDWIWKERLNFMENNSQISGQDGDDF